MNARARSLEVGTVGGRRLTLPLDLASVTMAIVGVRGAGKTVTAAVIAEELLKGGIPIVIVDPTDVWWGLKSSRDGKSEGFPVVIFGGSHADLPLSHTAGAAIADFVVERRVPIILSLRGLRKHQQRQFVTQFAEQLYHRKGEPEHRTPLFVVFDEASQFCLSEDTEILTQSGWRAHDQIAEGDLVPTYDPSTDSARVEPITRVSRRQFDGEMVRLRTQSVDCLCTPDHRVVLRKNQRGVGRWKYYDWMFSRAAEVPSHVQIPASRLCPGPGIHGMSCEILRVVGWVLTDGYVAQRSRSDVIAIEQSTSTMKSGTAIAELMGGVLEPLGARRSSRAVRSHVMPQGHTSTSSPSHRWYFGKGLSDLVYGALRLRPLPHSRDRRIPRHLIEDCNADQLRALLQGLLEGDGTFEPSGSQQFYGGLNEGIVDDVQEIAVRLGMRTTKRFEKSNGQYSVRLCPVANHWIRKPSREMYSGLVWDITVPSGAFFVRRNGRTFITGNCPQRVGAAEAPLVGAVQDLVRLGRASGFGVALVDQRPASVNKDVLTQLELLVAHRITSPQDRKALTEWVQQHDIDGHGAEFLRELAPLPTGRAWFWSPLLNLFSQVDVRNRDTFDSSKTPKIGERVIAPERLAPVDLERIREELAEAVTAAEENDPKQLKARIAELERSLRGSRGADPRVTELESVIATMERDREVALGHYRAMHADRNARMDRLFSRLRDVSNTLAQIADEWPSPMVFHEGVPAPGTSAAGNAAAPPLPQPRKRVSRAVQSTGNSVVQLGRTLRAAHERGSLGAPEQRLLDALATYQTFGQTTVERDAVAAMAGYKPGSGHVNNTVGRLTTAGLVEIPSPGLLQLTAAGAKQAAAMQVNSLDDVHRIWLGLLNGPQQKILAVLLEDYPDPVARDQLAARAGFQPGSGHVNNTIGSLTSLKAADIPRKGYVVASRLLFPEGL